MYTRVVGLVLISSLCSGDTSVAAPRGSSGVVPSTSHLRKARELRAPAAVATKGGENEDAAFWDKHKALLSAAWAEYGKRHPDLYTKNGIEGYIHPRVKEAWAAARAAEGGKGHEELVILRNVVSETPADDVYAVELFTDAFHRDLQEELGHLAQAGIPIRRPNGMNRHGVILEDVGMADSISSVVGRYLAPLAQLLYPEHITAADVTDHHAFSIRYKIGDDVSLAEHSDASAFTFNLCLGGDFTGSEVAFPQAAAPAVLTQKPGVALLHRGMKRHYATKLESGQRTNLVVWMFGDGGYVRVAPYPAGQRSTPKSRWNGESEVKAGEQALLSGAKILPIGGPGNSGEL
eukprot:Rhum_TRINITY_DN17011_c0_g1::Rhum_TRINITY_DN17011_c0_g1_i1::g.165046::m.165046